MEAGMLLMVMMATLAVPQTPEAGQPPDPYRSPIALIVPGMAEVRVDRDRPYRDGPDAPRLDVYRPKGSAPAPVIVYVPGGPVPRGTRVREWGVFTSYGRAAAAQGFVAVTIEHRFHDPADLAAAAANLAAAVAWVRAHAAEIGADPGRVAIWGFSGAGMLLAPLIASPPDGLRALVMFYAALDLRPETLAARPELRAYSAVSALEARSEWTTPLVVGMAGRDDARLNEAMERFATRALRLHAPLDLLVHPQGLHGFDILNPDDRSRDIIARAFAVIAASTERDRRR
jgi:acetyl esterase/lipase